MNIDIAIQDNELLDNDNDDTLNAYADIMSDPIKRKAFEEFRKVFQRISG